ncbi:MAG TPA: ABC transporter permease [Thermomicrobiaceae bacterium]|nr:ABC transporter permease [Thermomicrobiaceae bacterium]
MSLKRILTIFRKDLFDAMRDARVLMAIVAPLGIGILYSYMFAGTPTTPTATVAYAAADQTALIDTVRSTVGTSITLTFNRVADAAAVRQAVLDKKADVGLVIPAGFDAAVRTGQTPNLAVLLPESSTYGGDYVAATLEPALRQMAGQGPVAAIQTERLSAPTATELTSMSILNRIGLRDYFLIAAVVMLVAMIAMLALPIILAEETEKKTLDAVGLIASYTDVVVGKSLVGGAYITVSIVLLLGVTRLMPANLPLFVAGVFAFSVALIGFGLLIGGLFRSANQLNTWGGLILVPVIAPAFIVGLDAPRVVNLILWLIPSSQATRLIINAVSGQAIFPSLWSAFLVIAGWAVLAYLLLIWRLGRREA